MVNTFITSKSLIECAKNLDFKRLGKQQVEAYQIIRAIENGKSSWINHPVSRMWKLHVDALKIYFNHMVREWVAGGYNNNMALYDVDESSFSFAEVNFDGNKTIVKTNVTDDDKRTFPWWFGWDPMMYSHRASLLRKDPSHYGPLFLTSPEEEERLQPYLSSGYIWPDTLPESAHEHFDLSSMAIPLGLNNPISHFQFTRDELDTWQTRPTINPRTGRSISMAGLIYKEYKVAYEWHSKNGEGRGTTAAGDNEEEEPIVKKRMIEETVVTADTTTAVTAMTTSTETETATMAPTNCTPATEDEEEGKDKKKEKKKTKKDKGRRTA